MSPVDTDEWHSDAVAPRVHTNAVVSIPARLARGGFREAAHTETRQWADEVAERIDTRSCGVVLRLGEHARSPDEARHLGRSVAQVLCDALIRRGAPPAMEVERDKPQRSMLLPGHRHRTLLPHHDGGNASYLTPSINDDADWNCELRRTSPRNVTTTRAHKLYQGFILQHPGDAESATTYYDLLKLVWLAHGRQTGDWHAPIPQMARWLGQNIRRAIAAMAVHGGTYLTLGGLLGAARLSHVIVPVHHAEAELEDAVLRHFPDLADLAGPGEAGLGGEDRLLDRVLRETLGFGWHHTRRLVEVAVHGEPYDFIVGHNITLLHGGWRGGHGRVIEPICFVLERAAGPDYEQWLAGAWRR